MRGRDEQPAAALEAIRACVHRWIDAIEAQLDALPESECVPEAEGRDREWAERLEALEHDRRLLAAAWEEVERARTTPAPGPAADAPLPPVLEPRPAAPAAQAGPGDPVDRTVLRQFESLRRDVRRAAEARNPS
jgi:hypothetical protein